MRMYQILKLLSLRATSDLKNYLEKRSFWKITDLRDYCNWC